MVAYGGGDRGQGRRQPHHTLLRRIRVHVPSNDQRKPGQENSLSSDNLSVSFKRGAGGARSSSDPTMF